MSDTIIDERLERFKERIGFNELSPVRSIDNGILINSEDPGFESVLAGHGWATDGSDFYTVGPNLAMRSHSYKKDDQSLVFDITVSSGGEELVREALLQIASFTQPTEIPYVKGPNDLGDLSICLPPNPMYQNIIWIQHNLLSKLVMYTDSFEDALEVARQLNKLLSQGVVNNLTSSIPIIESATASPPSIQVGDTTKIKLALPEESDDQIDIEFIPPEGVMESTDIGEISATFTGIEAGSCTIGVHVTNTRTLLMKIEQVAVDIVPKVESE